MGSTSPQTWHRLIAGDAHEVLKREPADSVDLIVTSPPYADARRTSYGGPRPEGYVEWFLPISAQLLRVLRPTGTFVLNIKECCRDGERHPYVLELVLALRDQGWRWTEELIWHKKHCYPGKWPNRFRDAWERLLQFNKSEPFAMYQEAVRVPAKGTTVARSRQVHPTNGQLQVVSGSSSGLVRRVASCARVEPKTGSGFGKNPANFVGRSLVYPDNVLYLPVETHNRGHSAPFPEALPDWFVRLFTKPGDVVLDPFMGSGTTNAVAKRLGRSSIGIDRLPRYVSLARERLAVTQSVFSAERGRQCRWGTRAMAARLHGSGAQQ